MPSPVSSRLLSTAGPGLPPHARRTPLVHTCPPSHLSTAGPWLPPHARRTQRTARTRSARVFWRRRRSPRRLSRSRRRHDCETTTHSLMFPSPHVYDSESTEPATLSTTEASGENIFCPFGFWSTNDTCSSVINEKGNRPPTTSYMTRMAAPTFSPLAGSTRALTSALAGHHHCGITYSSGSPLLGSIAGTPGAEVARAAAHQARPSTLQRRERPWCQSRESVDSAATPLHSVSGRLTVWV